MTNAQPDYFRPKIKDSYFQFQKFLLQKMLIDL